MHKQKVKRLAFFTKEILIFFQKTGHFLKALVLVKKFAKVCTVNERHAGPVQTGPFGRFKEDDLL